MLSISAALQQDRKKCPESWWRAYQLQAMAEKGCALNTHSCIPPLWFGPPYWKVGLLVFLLFNIQTRLCLNPSKILRNKFWSGQVMYCLHKISFFNLYLASKSCFFFLLFLVIQLHKSVKGYFFASPLLWEGYYV